MPLMVLVLQLLVTVGPSEHVPLPGGDTYTVLAIIYLHVPGTSDGKLSIAVGSLGNYFTGRSLPVPVLPGRLVQE